MKQFSFKTLQTIDWYGIEMSEEKELLCGKIIGTFYHPSLVLTNRRLIIGERSIGLSDILKAYSKKEKLQSKMVIQLKDGKTEELTISPGKVLAPFSFSGSVNTHESEMRASSEATTERWVNQVNECLSSIKKTNGTSRILNDESSVRPITESPPEDNLKNDDHIARFVKVFSKPVSGPVSQDSLNDVDKTKRLRILDNLLEDNLITDEDFVKRKRQILSEK
jgi:hypothetical protein